MSNYQKNGLKHFLKTHLTRNLQNGPILTNIFMDTVLLRLLFNDGGLNAESLLNIVLNISSAKDSEVINLQNPNVSYNVFRHLTTQGNMI